MSDSRGNWVERPLAELCDPSRGITYGIVKVGDYVKGGVPVIRGGDIRGNVIVFDDAKRVSQEVSSQFERTVLRGGELVINLIAEPGHCALVPKSMIGFNVSRDVAVIPLGSDVNHVYVNYYLKSSAAVSWLMSRLQGSVTLKINLGTLRDVPVPTPPKRYQDAIAELLSALDDKIAVNERISRVSAHLALAYGHQSLSQADGDEVALADHAGVVKGVSYRSADLGSGNDRLVTLKCVGRDGTFQNGGLKQYSGDYKESQVVDNGDVVVAQTDLTQKADVIGRPVRVTALDYPGRLVASLDLVIVRPGPLLSREVLLALLSTQSFRDHAIAYCNGTTVLHMGVRALPEYRFRLPSWEIVRAVSEFISPVLDRSGSVQRENLALAGLRDTLLLGLMSGEIRMRDAEKAVEGAT